MKFSSGIAALDNLLTGGYEQITTIYGPAGAGKTLLCLLAAQTIAGQKKVIYIDSEGGFAASRMCQLAPPEVLERILFFRPKTFKEQEQAINRLPLLITNKVGLIIIDSISMLHRISLMKNASDSSANLGKQLAALIQLSRKTSVPLLITSHVYDAIDEPGVVMAGGELLKYSSKCLLELQITPKQNRRITIHKPKKEESIVFSIQKTGITVEKERTI